MPLDFLTLMVVMVANLFMISAALPLIMGRDAGRAARHIQGYALLQTTSLAAIITSARLWDQPLSTVSMACQAAAQWQLYRALEEWLGPRPLRRWLLVLVVAMPLGYTLGFHSYPWRVGWANGLLAAILFIVARATLHPVVPADLRWRSVLLGCLVASAVFTLARGVLGAFTDQYPSFRTPHPVNLTAALVNNVSMVLGTVAALVAWRDEAEQKLRALAMTDGLTGLLNRRSFDAQGQSLLDHAHRHRLPLTALMLDLDHFKHINDTHGHEAGDRALQLFARLLNDTVRSGDLIARLGGEEFAVLMLDNAAAAGVSLDLRLRQRLHDVSAAKLGFVLDYSAGMAVLPPGEASLAALMARADGALYLAKAAGRGQLMASS